MNNKLNELVASVSLPPKVKKVADYVIENLQECCFLSSMELAETLSVSYSSVIRLTKLLGFSGYPEFQKFLREVYSDNSEIISESIVIPAERLEKIIEQGRTSHVQDSVMAHVFSNIQSTIANNPESQYQKACKLILDSDLKYILSCRGCHCIAEFLGVIMRQTVPHVYSYVDCGPNIFDFTSDAGPDDCIISIAFPRYSRPVIMATEMAKRQGAKVILITDRTTSPLTRYADVVLTARCESSDYYNSYVTAMMVAELLCAHLSRMTNYSNKELLKRIDEYTSQFGNY